MAESSGHFNGPPKTPFTVVELERENTFALFVLWVSLIFGGIAAIVFLIHPGLDFTLTNQLREGSRFVLRGDDFWSLVRRAIMWGYGIAYVVMIAGLVRSLAERQPVWNIYPAQWFYMVACSLAGPLLVTNLILKTYIGRPRPRSVIEYGGDLDFTPVFHVGGKCMENCSFVSGEVSSMVMLFACAMFASRQWRTLFALLLLPAWAFSAFLRVGAGAHFPSDTFFAGVFMLVLAALLYKLIVLAPGNVMLKRRVGERAF